MNILLDVHRTFFLPLPEAAPPDGSRETVHGPTRVRERWEAGRLVERRIRPLAETPDADSGEIVITYVGGAGRGVPPGEVRIDNQRYGYRIDLRTLAYEPLTCDP